MAEWTNQERNALRASGQELSPAFQVGKSGVTDGVVNELQNHLSRAPLVKVKFLAASRGDADTKALAEDVAKRARVRLVEVRGHTALFYRAPRHKREPGEF